MPAHPLQGSPGPRPSRARRACPRRAPRRRRSARLRRCERAVSEVMGYILMFFLSSAILMLSLQAFLYSRTTSDDLRAATELKLVSERVAAEVAQAGVVASEVPEATYEVLIRLPDLGGRDYYVNASHGIVWANTTDGRIAANTTAFQVEALTSPNLYLQGTVYGSQGYLKVRYDKPPSGARTITLLI